MKSRGHAHQVALLRRAHPGWSRVDSHLICTPAPRQLSSAPLWQPSVPLHTRDRDQARPEQPGWMLPAAKSAKGKTRPMWDGGSSPRLSTTHGLRFTAVTSMQNLCLHLA